MPGRSFRVNVSDARVPWCFFCEVGPERVILRRCKTLWEKARVNWWVKVLFFWLFDFFCVFFYGFYHGKSNS